MNRCLSFLRTPLRPAAALLGVSLFALPAAAQWLEPQRIPPIPPQAVRGVLEVTAPPEALLDGQPARLAPGARIRDRNNLMVVSGALIGQKNVVRYTRDPLGLLQEIWVLTPAEIAASAPAQPALPAH
ncbi:MAG: hypothetical protein ACK4MJ_05560 [Hylemonella sp.]